MNGGFICEWDFNSQLGQIHRCNPLPELLFPFSGDDCCAALQQILAKPENNTIHADGPCPGFGVIQVKFDVDLNGNAIRVDITDSIGPH